MRGRIPGLALLIALLAAAPAAAETLQVFGAGSLNAAFTDLLRRFPAGSDTLAAPEFGPSGLMRQKIEGGAPADIMASADMDHARKLAAGHPDRIVLHFARNSLCALARADSGTSQANLLDRLLDPAVRLATSTRCGSVRRLYLGGLTLRLIVPGERRAGRSVRDVVRIDIE